MFSNSLPPRVKYGSVEEERKRMKRKEASQFIIRLRLIVKKFEEKCERNKNRMKEKMKKNKNGFNLDKLF